MRYALANLWRNLCAGLKLACFRRVDRLAFRIDLVQLLLLFVLSAAIDAVGDWFRATEPREFSLQGAGSEFYAGAVLLFASALIALFNRQRHVALALPVIVLAALPVVQALHYLPYVVAPSPVIVAALPIFEYAIVTWIVFILIRCVAVAFAPLPSFAWLRAIGGGLLLAAPIWFGNALVPSEPWWRAQGDDTAASGGLNAASEAVLAAQSFLLNHVLEKLQEERPGQTDLYFVGFTPDGRQNAYRADAEAARNVMDTRWGTDGRSVLLVNNPQTLITIPFATATNLRETLNELGSIIDAEDDVVMIYLASRGTAEHRLAADQPPLSLVELAPAGLKQLLDDAGIKWRIIVVSACYSGGFIAPLADAHTLIVTDAQADRVSFGCGDRSPPTLFGDAFFHALGKGDSFATAFDGARARVAERERDAGYSPPANPQISVGTAMADKLKMLRRRGASGATADRATLPLRG